MSPLNVVLDTDTYNEVDDQFALAHLALSPDKINLQAVYAAPFHIPGRSTGPGDGMLLSYDEIHRVLDLMPHIQRPKVFEGSDRYLEQSNKPVPSAAVDDLIERAMSMESDKLEVVSIGAITNIASALLKEPKIAEKIHLTWLGGHTFYWHNTNEFNLKQDLLATTTVLQSDVEMTIVPCMPVAVHLSVTAPDLREYLIGSSKLGDYLGNIVIEYGKNAPCWSKPLWDVAASAYLVTPEHFQTSVVPAMIPSPELRWVPGRPGRKVTVVDWLKRDPIITDLFTKLKAAK